MQVTSGREFYPRQSHEVRNVSFPIMPELMSAPEMGCDPDLMGGHSTNLTWLAFLRVRTCSSYCHGKRGLEGKS